MKRALSLSLAAALGLALAAGPSLALDPAGGPPEPRATESSEDREDASVGDDGVESATPGIAPSSQQRSWLGKGSSRASSNDESQTDDSGQGSGFTLGALLIVLALAAAAIVVRHRRGKRAPIPVSESRLTVLSSSRIGPKAYAVTAHVGGRVMLLGVTDHTVTHLGWLDAPEEEAPIGKRERRERLDEPGLVDDLPDDYPGSALRAASGAPGPLASTSDLKRFQEVLRGAVQSRSDLGARSSHTPGPPSAASTLAAQTNDILEPSRAPKARAQTPSLRRKRQRRESLPADDANERATGASAAADPGVEGQVAGLRALRNG